MTNENVPSVADEVSMGNQQKRPSEYYAKLILEKTFPDRFYDLEIVDKPDLQNLKANIGIEVTSAESQESKELNNRFHLLSHNKGTKKQQEKSKERLKQLGAHYFDGGFMVNWSDHTSLDRVYLALKKKLKKLNECDYTIFEQQHLFVFYELTRPMEDVNVVLSKFEDIQSQFSNRFLSIFLYLRGNRFFEFDMISRTCSSTDVCETELFNQMHKFFDENQKK